MTWAAYHRRGEVLRTVIDEANTRQDGVLPMELPGVAETFGDEATLLGALQLRWHTRLAGTIERELLEDPADATAAVLTAWRRTAQDLAGIRAILDARTAAPGSEEIAALLATAHGKDWSLLAVMAGRVNAGDPRAEQIGRDLEHEARAAYRPKHLAA